LRTMLSVPRLIIPRVAVAVSVRAAAIQYGDDPQPAYASTVAALSDDELPGYIETLLAYTREGSPRPTGFVPSTHPWPVESEQFLGRIHIRHRLSPSLRDEGAHLGYHVIPPHRRRGHATAMLAAALPVAAALGTDCLLLSRVDATVIHAVSRLAITRGRETRGRSVSCRHLRTVLPDRPR
jgi:predicted acetyltransferase